MNKIWHARWITDKKFLGLKPIDLFRKELDKAKNTEHRDDLKNHHMLYRKKFTVSDDFSKATLDITADDYYKLYVNGTFVGQGPAPSYHFSYGYNSYDISKYLKNGENLIAVHVFYQGLINRVWNSGDYRQGMIAELFLDENMVLCTDDTWKTAYAEEFVGRKTTGYETYFIEDIDLRLKKDGWTESEYDDSGWGNPCENTEHDYTFKPQPTPTVSVYKVQPKEVTQVGDGEYIIDFGHELTGSLSFNAQGKRGTEIEVRCGEEMDGQDVRYDMRCNCNYREIITLSGKPDVLEHYDYKAFRYAQVCAQKGSVDVNSFCAMVRHYPFDSRRCTFKSSNNMLNKIWEICKRSIQYGTQEGYLDCPSREKGQYLGDMLITASAHAYLTGDLTMFRKGIADFALSSHICPGLMAVAPGGFMQEIADYSLVWPLELLIYYRMSGDIQFLREMYPILDGLMGYFRRYERSDGLLENLDEKWNMVDWPDNLRDGYDFDLTVGNGQGCHNVLNAFYCGAENIFNQIRDILGIAYDNRFPKLKNAYIKTFYNMQTGLFTDSEESSHSSLHANVMPLFYDLVPDGGTADIIELIRCKRLNCGVYFSYFLFKALARAGEYALIYELLTCDDEHSWQNMVKEGATTCFEAWGKNQKWNTSLCHPWASTPILIILEDILGITPATPGWDKVRCLPHIPSTLSEVELSFRTIKGTISFKLKDGEGAFDLDGEMEPCT